MKKNILISLLFLVVLVITIFLLILLISDKKEFVEDQKINVMVSILPQIEFVERVGGDLVNVNEMIPPGFSPATYNPSPGQLQKLQSADIYFRIGHIPFEKIQIDRLKEINKRMVVVDTSEGIELLSMLDHQHEDEEDDSHKEGDDPHIWLSPSLVKIQANKIYESLTEISPENERYFYDNLSLFLEDLEELDKNLRESFKAIEGETIFVYHPAFGYLASSYGFSQEAVEIEGKDPSPSQLKEIIDKAKDHNVKTIFVQEQFNSDSAEAVAREINGSVIKIDPLARDYFLNLERMAEKIINYSK
jgi:zinc transport system substrate-binding protein